MKIAKRSKALASMVVGAAIVGMAWVLYFVPHLQAGSLPLIPGEYIGFFLFYRNGQLTISNFLFLIFESVANIAFYAVAVRLILFTFNQRSSRMLIG